MKKVLKKIKKSLIKFDLFGHPIEFTMKSKTTVRSKFSAIVSIGILGVFIYLFLDKYLSWINNKNLQIISSSQTFNIDTFNQDNQSYVYNFDSNNYYIRFFVSSQINSKTYSYSELTRYFNASFYFRNENGEIQYIESENCYDYKSFTFLEENSKITNYSSQNNESLCISNTLKMGILNDPDSNPNSQPTFYFMINMCQNTSENINQCAPKEDILNVLMNTTLQVNFPKTILDFKNIENPRKRLYDNKFYKLSDTIQRKYIFDLVPITLDTDLGLFSEQYGTDTIDFNVGSYVLDFSLIEDDPKVFELGLRVGMNQQTYYRQNEEVTEFLSHLGGITHMILIIGKMICSSYNFLILKYKMINIMFSNPSDKRINKKFEFSLFIFDLSKGKPKLFLH